MAASVQITPYERPPEAKDKGLQLGISVEKSTTRFLEATHCVILNEGVNMSGITPLCSYTFPKMLHMVSVPNPAARSLDADGRITQRPSPR